MKKLMLAMSGGVDSSAALVILKKEYDVVGATLKLHDGEYEVNGKKTCCSLKDIEDAKKVAEKFGVEHYVYEMKELFGEKVIENFISTYERGMTPNPCIDCNKNIKFGALLEKAKELGCDYIATGHYARVEYDEAGGRWLLKKAISSDGANDKDQSYVLYTLSQEQLSHIVFPLGEMKKQEVRSVAAENELVNADKSDSQDICFVPDGDYAAFIEKTTGKVYPSGNVVDVSGKIYGKHNGLINYTIGQRKGLGIAFGSPMYVVAKNINDNTLVVGTSEELMAKSLTADDMNWIAFERPSSPFRCSAKTRYRMAEQPCTVYPNDDGTVYVEFDKAQRAITPGQRVVFYNDDIVIGGGVITK